MEVLDFNISTRLVISSLLYCINIVLRSHTTSLREQHIFKINYHHYLNFPSLVCGLQRNTKAFTVWTTIFCTTGNMSI